MSESPSSSRRGSITRFVVVFVLLGAAITTTIAIGHRSSPSTVAAPEFTTVKVSTGTLTTSEQVDGSVVLSDVTEVLHRIDGQSASTSSAAASSSGSGPASTIPNVAAASIEVLTPVASTPCVTQSSEPVPTTLPDTTLPDTTVPSTATTAAPDTTAPAPAPDPTPATTATAPCETTSTTPSATPSSTPSSTPSAGGSRPSGSPSGGGGGSGGTVGATVGGAATGRVTEVITSIIDEGTPVSLGTVLYAVESRPVVAMSGALPAWRTLQVGSADGTDILQLELSLVALGYDRDHKMTVDNHFDSATKAAVKRWQTGYGLAVTGIVTLGSVVFLPWTATASSIARSVGDAVGDGDQVLTLAAASQTVLIDVPTGDESFVVPGLTVRIGKVIGTVELIRSVNQNGSTVVQAVIAPATPIEGASNGAAVKVTITHDGLVGALLVPADALVSRLDGTYAIEVAQPDGTGVWTPVEVLGVAGGSVAVKGNGIVDGTEVLRPV